MKLGMSNDNLITDDLSRRVVIFTGIIVRTSVRKRKKFVVSVALIKGQGHRSTLIFSNLKSF